MSEWKECRRKPCPICGHKGWCSVKENGEVVHCMRVESTHPCDSGGWIHFLIERPARPMPSPAPRHPVRQLVDMAKTMQGFRDEFESYRGGDIFDSLIAVAKDLNMRADHIDRLGVGRSAHYQSWCFPMLDADGNTIGVRLRRYGSSDKFSVPGSRDGLFYDPALEPMETVENGIKGREIVIVEGATDCIAGYAQGFACVGRSSCSTGAELLKKLCDRLRVTKVTIFADNDNYKIRPSGMPYRPGLDGAKQLGERLGRAYRIITLPRTLNGRMIGKDLRDWNRESLCQFMCAQSWKNNLQRIPKSVHDSNIKAFQEVWNLDLGNTNRVIKKGK